MKKVIVCLLAVYMTGCASLQSPKETNVAVSKLLSEIQIAINEIDKQSKEKQSSLPPFKGATLTLTTKRGITNEGKASLILSGSKSKATTDTNTITLELVPNPTPTKSLKESKGHEIANYVIAAVSAIDENNYLKLKELTVVSGLEVINTGSGGIEVELVGVSITGGHKSTTSNGNTLKLAFGYPDKKEK